MELITDARGQWKIRLRSGKHIMRHVYHLKVGSMTVPCCRYTKPKGQPGWIALRQLNIYADSSRQPGSKYITSYEEDGVSYRQAVAKAVETLGGRGIELP